MLQSTKLEANASKSFEQTKPFESMSRRLNTLLKEKVAPKIVLKEENK